MGPFTAVAQQRDCERPLTFVMNQQVSMQRPSKQRQAGFSLVELVLVALIISVVAAIAVPRYANALARYRADAAARRVAADLQLARAEARSAGAARTLTFDVAAGALTINDVRPLNRGPGTTYRVLFGDEPYRAVLVTPDFGGDPAVTFDGYGNPDSGGSVWVRSGNSQRRVALSATTGLPTVD